MSPTPADSARRAEKLLRRLLVAVLVLGAVFYWMLITGQREGCERGKLDRQASARAFRAQSDYLNGVLNATSVQRDVKDAATLNQSTQNESATSLESRTGDRLDCSDAFPIIRLPF